jgi:hypothetical protein
MATWQEADSESSGFAEAYSSSISLRSRRAGSPLLLSRSNTVLTISYLLMLLRSFIRRASRSESTESPTPEPRKNVSSTRSSANSPRHCALGHANSFQSESPPSSGRAKPNQQDIDHVRPLRLRQRPVILPAFAIAAFRRPKAPAIVGLETQVPLRCWRRHYSSCRFHSRKIRRQKPPT